MSVFKDSAHCAGCSACMAVCPKSAIRMQSDFRGFMIPVVDDEICIHCGLCKKVCPLDSVTHAKGEPKAFAARYADDAVRIHSASGGFFQAVSDLVVCNGGGYSCGCALDSDMRVRHKVTDSKDGILAMAGSKYVQSDMENVIPEIAGLLSCGKQVVFSGCSCQVDGVLHYLEQKHISHEKLITIDFFCHGVPSPQIFKEYIKFYEQKKKIKIKNFSFRSKAYGWGKADYLNSVNSDNLHKPDFLNFFSRFTRMWSLIFLSNLTLREHCFNCPYASVDKPADFTMGDFWGIEKSPAADFDDKKGVSVVIAHTAKAEKLLSSMEKLELKEVSVYDATWHQANSKAPCAMPEQYYDFWEDYKNKGFYYVAKKYFDYNFKGKIKFIIKRILFLLHVKGYYI